MTWDRQITLKTPEELLIMRKAGQINAEALEAAYSMIKPGVSTAEINEAAEEVLIRYGVYSPFKNYPGPYPFPASTCVSVNDELVHGIPDKKRLLKEGDIVSVDCGTVYQGYVADSSFTAGVGVISEAAQRLLEVTEKALYAGIEKMVPGNRVGDVSSAVQNVVEQQGFFVTREYTGHGVGTKMHEGPQVPNYGTPGRGIILRSGMTVALEPMVLIGTSNTKVFQDQWRVGSSDGSLTAHFEHTIAITEIGPRILTLLENGEPPVRISRHNSNMSL